MSEETSERESARPTEPEQASPPRPKRRWPLVLLVVSVVGLAALRAVLPTAIERGLAWVGPRKLGVPIRLENADLALWRGEVVLKGLVVGPTDGEPDPERALLRWERLGLKLDWGSLLARRIHLREITLAGPILRIPLDGEGRMVLPEPPPGGDDTTDTDLAAEESVVPGAEDAQETERGDPDEPGWPLQIDAISLAGVQVRLVQEGAEIDPLFVALQTLEVEALTLVGGEIGLGGIALAEPQLRIRRDFILRDQPQPDSEPEQGGTSLDAFAAHRLAEFRIDDAHFTWITDNGPVAVTLGVRARDLSARRDAPFDIEIDLGLDEGSVRLAGSLGLNPITFTGSLAWRGLPLVRLMRAADPSLAAWYRTGTWRGELAMDARIDDRPGAGVKISGRTGLVGFDLAKPGDEEIAAAWQSLEVEISELFWPLGADGTPPPRIALGRVRLQEPRLLYTRTAPAPDATATAEAAAPETPPQEELAAAPEEPDEVAPMVTVAALEVDGGRIVFHDRSIEPAYDSELSNLAIRASALRWPE